MITLEDVLVFARTLYGEVRGESHEGRLAVAHVILNRLKKKHRKESTLIGVCTEPYQFSAWNENDPNRDKLQGIQVNDATFRECLIVALLALNDKYDPTEGAQFYHTNSIRPDWAKGKEPVVVIGNHSFYND